MIMEHDICIKTALFLAIVLTFSASCTSVKEITYLEDLPDEEARVVQEAAAYEEPFIEPGDLLNITVSTIDPLTSEAINQNMSVPALGFTSSRTGSSGMQLITGFPVDEEGYINMNYTGPIQLSGLTLAQARRKIAAEVEKYFKDAVVNIVYSNFRITVLGEVASPGVMVFPRQKVTIWDAIAMAGDLTILGRRDNVLLIRKINETENEYVRLNLNQSEVMQSPYFYLKQGDVLYVASSEARSVALNADRMQTVRIVSSITSTLALIATIVLNLAK